MDHPALKQANRTFICTVVFVDIVEYSKKPVAQQVALKTRFNEMLSQALQNIAVTDRITLDTGDGAALCFLGDPEDALFAANSLRDAARSEPGSAELLLRIGINLGPVKVVKDINGQPNIIGDGINVAQRIMSFGQPNQIVVSRSYYEVVSCLSQEYAQLFHYLGVQKDKHIREHTIYEVSVGSAADAAPPVAEAEGGVLRTHQEDSLTATGSQPPLPTRFEPQALMQLEGSLAKYMGPLAKLLVRKAAQKASNLQELCRMLAEGISTEQRRAAFLASIADLSRGPSPASEAASASAPGSSRAARDLPKDSLPLELSPEALALAERHLAKHIGPLAKILVKKEAKHAGSVKELYHHLAQNIENEQERRAFLAMIEQDRLHG